MTALTSAGSTSHIVLAAETDTATPCTAGDAALEFVFTTSTAGTSDTDTFYVQGHAAAGTPVVYGAPTQPITGLTGSTNAETVDVFIDYGASIPSTVTTVDIIVTGS